MPRITISYRRDDSGVITGRIFDRLTTHYGRDAIFRDIDSIPPGSDFREHINRVLEQSDILLAIVGPKWLGSRGAQTRLDDEGDPVRVEIEAGLRRKMPVIPVLVLRAAMPRVAQLPDTVKDFAYRHAVQVDAGQDFDVHAARLIRAMDRILRQKAGDAAAIEPEPPNEVLDLDGEVIGVAETLFEARPVAPPVGIPAPAIVIPSPPVPDPVAPRRERGRFSGLIGGLVIGAGVGAGGVAVAMVMLRPSLSPDIAALVAEKEAASARAVAVQAQFAGEQKKATAAEDALAGEQKKTTAAQDALAAAQKQAGDRDKQLKDLQASFAQAQKDLTGQKDIVTGAQARIAQLNDQVKSLGSDEARAQQAEADLAAEKKAAATLQDQLDQAKKDLAADTNVAATSQTQTDQLAALNDQLAAEKKAHQEALGQIAQLNAKLASASPTEPAAAPTDATAPPASADDSSWTVDQRRDAQNDLKTLGHLQGNADGNFGPTTRTAIKQYQSFAGDPETGVLTDAEQTQLHDMVQHLVALLDRGATSPDGVGAVAVKGAAARYARAWAAQSGTNGGPDPAEAMYWYGLAAADGDAQAFTNLGLLLARGQGVAKQSPGDAALLWWSAAARGGATAMFDLGAMWEGGIGVSSDPAKAKAWYGRAAAKGDTAARAALQRLGA